MKRIISLLLFCATIYAHSETFEAQTIEGATLTFEITGQKECQVSGMKAKDYQGGVTIPSTVQGYSVTAIGGKAFEDCRSMTSLTIPNSVRTIGPSACSSCYSLVSVIMPDSLKYIRDYTFSSCSSLTSITLPNNIMTIGNYAFQYCSSLSSINLPNTVEFIRSQAFYRCSALTFITIPKSVTFIANSAFTGCSSLISIIVESDNTVYDSRNNCNAIIETASNTLIQGCKNTVIPNSITAIGGGAFMNCSSLTTINLPNNVTSIGAAAFEGCSNLVSINLPQNVTSIGNQAFLDCISLVSINFPIGLTKIGDIAFGQCESLTSIIIPNNVTSIGESAFRDCNRLVEIRSHIQTPFSIKAQFNENVSLFVPIGKIDSYKEISGWPTNNIQELSALTPKIEIDESMVTIFTEDPNSDIYYSLDGTNPNRNNIRYDAPFAVNPSLYQIKAVALGDYMHDSPINMLVKGEICAEPVLITDENGITLTSKDNAIIRYTTDGSTPTTESTVYVAPFRIESPCTVKAIAFKEGYNNSGCISKTFTSLFKDNVLQLGESGVMKDAIGLWNLSDVEDLAIMGTINQDDIHEIVKIKSIRHLNLKECTVEGGALPEKCFAMQPFTSIIMPKSLTIGRCLFEASPNLAAIVWNETTIPTEALAGINNPNLLLYVDKEEDANNVHENEIQNVIVNGKARSITLSDVSKGNNNFYCPQPFTAESISYTHNYQLQTGIHECKGWETIALPFDVETVTHESKGILTTAVENDPTRPLYWLYEYTEDGFIPADNIRANTPFIISMPNNPAYSNEYNLSGKVTFTADNVTVPATDLHPVTKGAITFIPSFERVESSPYIFVMNQQDDDITIPAGSLFLPDRHEVRPFEAYATTNLEVKAIHIFEDETTDIQELKNEKMKE